MVQASSEEPVMNVLRNARYMAGWADEIGEKGLARRLIGKPMIEAAHANVRDNLAAGGGFWEEKPLSLGIEQDGTRARWGIERLLAEERQAA